MTPQLKKLGLVPGARWSLDNPPAGWGFEIGPDAADRVPAEAPADVIIAFVQSAAEITPTLLRREKQIFPAGALWIAWPRKASGHVSDVGDAVVRDAALARALVDVKVAALDADWSALKLVWRKTAR